MNNYPLYKRMALTMSAYNNCVNIGNIEWKEKNLYKLEELIDELPHGSGIDDETKFDIEKSTPDELIINIKYHCLSGNGFYDGWYNYKIIVTPSMVNDFNLNIIGRDTPNGSKEYLYQTFQYAFRQIEEK